MDHILQEAIAAAFKGTLKERNTQKKSFVRQWKKNLVKTMKGLGLPSLVCVAHSLNPIMQRSIVAAHHW